MDKKGLIANKILKYIKTKTKDDCEYRKVLTETIVVMGNELKKERVSKTMDAELIRLTKNKDAKAIYEIAKQGGNGCKTEDLINAIIETGSIEYIACVAGLCTKLNITKQEFLKCCKVIAESKDIDAVIWLSNHCTGTYTTRNTFDVLNKFVNMIAGTNDTDYMQEIIKEIYKRHFKQKLNGGSVYTPIGQTISTEQIKFRNKLENILSKKREL